MSHTNAEIRRFLLQFRGNCAANDVVRNHQDSKYVTVSVTEMKVIDFGVLGTQLGKIAMGPMNYV